MKTDNPKTFLGRLCLNRHMHKSQYFSERYISTRNCVACMNIRKTLRWYMKKNKALGDMESVARGQEQLDKLAGKTGRRAERSKKTKIKALKRSKKLQTIYEKEGRRNLTDRYVLSRLRLSREDVPKALVEAKREMIKLQRLIKKRKMI